MMRACKVPMIAFSFLLILALVAPSEIAVAASQYGGTVLYYDANWNLVGYWYKPCQGNSTRWGVVGVNALIDDFYSCGSGGGGGCNPFIAWDAPVGQPPAPYLDCT